MRLSASLWRELGDRQKKTGYMIGIYNEVRQLSRLSLWPECWNFKHQKNGKENQNLHFSHLNRIHAEEITQNELLRKIQLCTHVLCCAQSLAHVWFLQPPDCSPPGSSVHGILQARLLEWVAIPFSRGPFWTRDRSCLLPCRQILYRLSHQGSLLIFH